MPFRAEAAQSQLSWEDLVVEADSLLRRLFPICRSLTGEGVRQSLAILRQVADFEPKELASGTPCYDWVVPDEWNVRDAYVADSSGKRVIDFRRNNLHLVHYSVPVDQKVTFSELAPHLHTLPELPKAVPYRTSYYDRDWGFCLAQEEYDQLNRKDIYHVFIDSTLGPGSLTYGETSIPGDSEEEYLFSTYCCHPSLANDNLSGLVLWALLLRELRSRETRHTYRFMVVPETIGAIAYLSQNEHGMKQVAGGFVVSCVAGPGKFAYKHTFLNNHLIDRVVHETFREQGLEFLPYPFDINGSDEKHYSAPYYRIPVGTIAKDKYYEYDFYHTSLDDLTFISARSLVDSLKLYLLAIEKLELNFVYRSLSPKSEPMLGKRGLYPKIGGHIKQRAVDFRRSHHQREYAVSESRVIFGNELDAMRWILFCSDGDTPLLDIAEQTALPLRQLYEVAERLCEHGLLERETHSTRRRA